MQNNGMYPGPFNGAMLPPNPQTFGYGQPQLPNPAAASNIQLQPKSNIILVHGLDEAMARMTEPNCVGVFFDQDVDVFYRISTDNWGRKEPNVFEYKRKPLPQNQSTIIPDASASEYVSKKDFDDFKNQMLAILRGGQENAKSNESTNAVPGTSNGPTPGTA